MILKVKKSSLKGDLIIPGSKSHTIRAYVFAALADGVSEIINPLSSADTLSCLKAVEVLGAEIVNKDNRKVEIRGTSGKPRLRKNTIDVGNSGTTLRLLISAAALQESEIEFDGDESIRKRPISPLLESLKDLGASVYSEKGCCPCRIKGPVHGGRTFIDGTTSQYLSSLLISAPLFAKRTDISPVNLNEKPYVRITLRWLDEMGIDYECDKDLSNFSISPGQVYKSFKKFIPSDFSTACFGLCAALVTNSELTLTGLDFSDTQGDKLIFEYARLMGADIKSDTLKTIIRPAELKGGRFDLNATPDALPVMAVLGCFAEGETTLYNVAQARIKECDRIDVMTRELRKMGADIQEMSDGMVIRKSDLKGSDLEGHDDHRVVMALACAAMNATGETSISTPLACKVTYPGFIDDFSSAGADFILE